MILGILGIGLAFFFGGLTVLLGPPTLSLPLLSVTPGQLQWLGIAFTTVGIILICVSVVMWFRSVPKTIIRASVGAIEKRYESRLRKIKVEGSTLDKMYLIGNAVTGEGFLNISKLREHFDLQPAGYACWESIPDFQLRAFYVFVPLTQQATELFLLAKVQDALAISQNHICRRVQNATALYVTEIYGEAFPWSGVIIDKMRTEIRALAAKSPKLKYLLAKPVSPKGLKLVASHGFKPIPGSLVWKYEIRDKDRSQL